jgi:hypothetical protein
MKREMLKKILTVFGLLAEIYALFFITERVFWEVYWRTGRVLLRLVEQYIRYEAAAWITLEAIFFATLAVIFLLIKLKFLRNPYAIVLVIWFFSLADLLAFFCLLLPFMHKS